MQIGPDIAVVALAREVDITVTPAFKDHVDELLHKGCSTFILNFADVDYIDSSGLGVLIYLYRMVNRCSGSVSLVNVSDDVMRILSLARLLDVIPAHGTLSERKAKLSSKPAQHPHLLKIIRVPDDPALMGEVRAQISAILRSSSLEDADVFDMVLAVGEALGNAFDHGSSRDGSTRVYISIVSYDDRIVIEVTDCGCGVEVSDHVLPTPTLTRGRGIRLMYLLADSVEISKRAFGQGTSVKLIKLR